MKNFSGDDGVRRLAVTCAIVSLMVIALGIFGYLLRLVIFGSWDVGFESWMLICLFGAIVASCIVVINYIFRRERL